MFYSHEILTKREYGVATVWYGTSKLSQLRPLTIKAGRDDWIQRYFSQGRTEGYPSRQNSEGLRNRLSSEGSTGSPIAIEPIVGVYGQQTEYLYNDASSAHMNLIRFSVASATEDRVTLVKTRESRPEQLILTDDPTLAPELLNHLDLGSLDGFDLGNLNLEDSIPASSTPMPFSRSPSYITDRFSLGDTSSPGGSMGSWNGGLRRIRSSPQHPHTFLEEDRMEDLPFEFDENGELRERTSLFPEGRGIDTTGAGHNNFQDRSRAISVPRTHPHHTSIHETILDHTDRDLENSLEVQDNTNSLYAPPEVPEYILKDAIPFDTVAGIAQHRNQTTTDLENAAIKDIQEIVVKKKRTPRISRPLIDEPTQLPVSTMRQNQHDYPHNMEETNRLNMAEVGRKQAQTASRIMVLECGIGGQLTHPDLYSMFSGAAVLRAAQRKQGIPLEPQGEIEGVIENGEMGEPDGQPVSRGPEILPELGLEYIQDIENISMRDIETPLPRSDLEVGRDDPGQMPWNRSISIIRSDGGDEGLQNFSGGVYPSSDVGEPFSDFGSASIKMTPSPRRAPGRPSERMSVLRTVPEMEEEHIHNFGVGFNLGLDEDEFFGAGANLQTQGDIQTAQDTLERESFNFLGYLTAKINEHAENVEADDGMDFITFHELVRPGENRPLVAAQALHHVLFLACKNLIAVSQEEPYGTIQIGSNKVSNKVPDTKASDKFNVNGRM